MRRMLDKKELEELGGGGEGTTRHGYSIFVHGRFHYEVYTTKDYG